MAKYNILNKNTSRALQANVVIQNIDATLLKKHSIVFKSKLLELLSKTLQLHHQTVRNQDNPFKLKLFDYAPRCLDSNINLLYTSYYVVSSFRKRANA